jgi:hypothetical protein
MKGQRTLPTLRVIDSRRRGLIPWGAGFCQCRSAPLGQTAADVVLCGEPVHQERHGSRVDPWVCSKSHGQVGGCRLVEVVRIDGHAAFDTLHALGPDREHTVLVLQHPVDEQERLAHHRHPVAIE